jgi:hypothetical protein
MSACLDSLVEVKPTHARFDDRVSELLVDLEHLVHVAERQHQRAPNPRSGAAIPVVLAPPERPEGHAVFVGDSHDRLNVFDAAGADYTARHIHRRPGELERILKVGQVLGIQLLRPDR